jgi:hypothetical protein
VLHMCSLNWLHLRIHLRRMPLKSSFQPNYALQASERRSSNMHGVSASPYAQEQFNLSTIAVAQESSTLQAVSVVLGHLDGSGALRLSRGRAPCSPGAGENFTHPLVARTVGRSRQLKHALDKSISSELVQLQHHGLKYLMGMCWGTEQTVTHLQVAITS